MSKTDALRAIKDARRADATAAAAKTAAATTVAGRGRPPATPVPVPVPVSEPVSPPTDAPAEPPEGLCGHRSMNGRTCRRPGGHPEKNHRYG